MSNFSPFELATGQQPLTPHTIATGGGLPSSLLCQEVAGTQRLSPNLLRWSSKTYEWSDDPSLLGSTTRPKTSTKPNPTYLNNRQAWPGLWRKKKVNLVEKQIEEVAYRLKRRARWKLTPYSMWVSWLRLDQTDPERNVPTRAPPDVVDEPTKEEIEYIIDDRTIG